MSRDMVFEDVPHLSRRVGDNVIANQNNSTIILGRDRFGSVQSGYGSSTSQNSGRSAGSIHAIVGRKGTDPSTADDAATLHISAMTDPDGQSGTETIGAVSKGVPAIVLRADCVRIVPRTDIKISVGRAYMTIGSDGRIVIDGEISLGAGAADRLIKGDTFAAIWASHVHPTPVGPSGPPPPLPENALSSRPVRVA